MLFTAQAINVIPAFAQKKILLWLLWAPSPPVLLIYIHISLFSSVEAFLCRYCQPLQDEHNWHNST